MHLLLMVIFITTTVLLASEPAVTGELEIREWDVPYSSSRPRDPFAEGEDSVWFVGQRSGYLGHLDAASGKFSKVDLKSGSGPHNLIVDSDGIVWYAGNRNALIGRYDPRTGSIEEIGMPDTAARDPHTLVFDGDESHIWFTVQGGNMIGRLDIDSRDVDLIESKTQGSRPYGIKVGSDGAMWVTLFGTHKLAHVDPQTMELTEFELPRDSARPRRLEVLKDGRVWYVDYAGGRLGVYDPAADAFTEWLLPQGEDSRPYGMASDSEGRLWMVASGVEPNVFVGFDPETEEFIDATPIPSGGGTVRHMYYHAPSGRVWFGADTNTIGYAVVEPDRHSP